MSISIRRREFIRALSLVAASGVTAKLAHADGGPIYTDVCVIGGGSAGIYTAIQLNRLGYGVTVLERSGQIGVWSAKNEDD
jgi:heterodisulfide reductase subunit A-like polyferredoxin